MTRHTAQDTTPDVTPDVTQLKIPEMSLVILIGVSGSGKSYFARRHFKPTQVVSSDACRGVVSDDENDQSATADAFDVLHYVVRKRLRRGLLTVVDATNVQPKARQALIQIAKEHDVLTVAIVFDVPESLARERNAVRTDRSLPGHVIPRQRRELRRGFRELNRAVRRVYVLDSPEAADAAVITYERAWTDLRDHTGPFDLIGDVHGCRSELESLLTELDWQIDRDEIGRPCGARHPRGRTAVFLGDLVDRGPDTPGVLRLAMGMVAAGTAICVPGNHENKLVRALKGRKVRVSHGLAESLGQLEAEPAEFRDRALTFMDGLVSHYVLDQGQLVVAHAGLKEAYQGRASGRVRSFALYGETTGETDEYGLPVRYPWAQDYRGSAMVVYGHTPIRTPEWINNTLCVDTGCVFGGRLTALRYPERELVSVPAEKVWYEPVKPLAEEGQPAAGPGRAAHRPPDVLRIEDVFGIEGAIGSGVATGHLGRLRVEYENAAAALEVMSRFAIDPRWLVYLPPTMAPCASSERPGMLEHPAEALAAFRDWGVDRVVCEEKHMGSRAVVVVCRDETVAAERFGVDGATGAVYTRTGRPFLSDPALTEQLLGRLRAAVSAAGLWDELRTGWLVLDCELLPWSAKAVELIKGQYAATWAAARTVLPEVAGLLRQAADRGLEVSGLLEDATRRQANAGLFRDAYARYCAPTDGLSGLRLAPFQVLAAEGQAGTDRDHLWHLSIAERLAAADASGLLMPTRYRTVAVESAEETAAAVTWWERLTATGAGGPGGEGMVVKPLCGIARDQRGKLVQPGLKVRGREYLRIIYGPDYLEPGNLARLRDRSLGRKRSLALREYALGLEALDRFVAGEPLWRVHQAVFAVLALESEPVDPRL